MTTDPSAPTRRDPRQVLVRPEGIALAELPRPALAPDEVRIDVAYAGICGSELHHILDPERHGALGEADYGHEYSGVVSEVGERVATLAVGQPVACLPRLPCLRCPACLAGRHVNCRRHSRARNGAWAEEVVVADRFAHPLPEGVGLREAALCEPLSCALRGIDRGAAAPGHVAIVIGGGPIGALTAVLALHAGATEVLLSEPRAERRRIAAALGVTPVTPDELPAAVMEATGGDGAAVAYEAVGNPQCLVDAMALVEVGGTIVMLGLTAPDAVAPIPTYDLFEREQTLVAAWGHETTFARALAWLPRLELGALVTHELPLERTAEAIEIAASGDCGKVMLVPAR
jgi:L-gulonate 5-dehydrogenase